MRPILDYPENRLRIPDDVLDCQGCLRALNYLPTGGWCQTTLPSRQEYPFAFNLEEMK
jgi:hypothetical protein